MSVEKKIVGFVSPQLSILVQSYGKIVVHASRAERGGVVELRAWHQMTKKKSKIL